MEMLDAEFEAVINREWQNGWDAACKEAKPLHAELARLTAYVDTLIAQAREMQAETGKARAERDKALLQLSEAERKGRDLCQQNGELLMFLHRLKEDFCGWTCPSVWKTAEGQPHDQRCKDLRAMLDPSIPLKRSQDCPKCGPDTTCPSCASIDE